MSLLLATIISTSMNAQETKNSHLDSLKNWGESVAQNISENKVKYATTTIITAAILYDYYANNADVMRNAAAIAEKYSKIGFNKTTTSAQKLAVLVKENPVVAISAISGAVVISGSGIYLYKKKNAKISSTEEIADDNTNEIVIVEEILNKDETVIKPINAIKIADLDLPNKIFKHLKRKFKTVEDLPEDLTSIKGIGPKFAEIILNKIGLKIN